jgi:inner membrane protein
MDTITHLALGAVVGEALLGNKIGKKILIIGAAAQVLPDIDVVASLWLSPADNLLAHRGITHSLLFIPLAAIPLALLANRWHGGKIISLKQWLIFFLIQLALHDFIDGFNAYGVGWFEPFSAIRISFNTIFVVDPLFSTWLLIGAIGLIALGKDSRNKMLWVKVSLTVSTVYLMYALFNKYKITNEVEELLTKQQINHHRYFTTPTPMNTWLWFVVAEVDDGYHIGYRSVFDTSSTLSLEYFPRQDSLLKQALNKHELEQLISFSQSYYTVEQHGKAIVFNNLRFGQIAGWHSPRAPFAFHYYLNNPHENLMVIQRGRFSGWNRETAASLVNRIGGN